MDEVDGLLGGEFLAVVAAKFEVFFVDDVEFGGNGLEVGDAFGVGALDEVLDVVGDFGGEFLDYFVIFNGDDSNESLMVMIVTEGPTRDTLLTSSLVKCLFLILMMPLRPSLELERWLPTSTSSL